MGEPVNFTIGTASDDLVSMNGEYEDMPSGISVTFTLPSGETVVATADYECGWAIKIELPEGTTSKIDVCSCCEDHDCSECSIMGAGNCVKVCLEHGDWDND
jgi:hypothetical protein